jgi:hypothetical protein
MPRRLKGMPYRGRSASIRQLRDALTRARNKAATASQEVKRLEKLWNNRRPWYDCKRCGHQWQGVNPDRKPQCCAQCHSKGWERPSQNKRARKLSDAPNPAWDGRRTKKPAFDPNPKHFEYEEITNPKPSDYANRSGTLTLIEPEPVVPIESFGPPADLIEDMRRALTAPAGLPPPPSLEAIAPLVLATTPRESQMPAPPLLWRPREPIEPQPETFSRPQPQPPPEPEPEVNEEQVAYLTSIFPPLTVEDTLLADAAEEAWANAE